MKQTKIYSLLGSLLLSASFYCVKAQVTIGSNVIPDANALLDLKNQSDVNASTKGLLLPRVQLTATDKFAPLSAHVMGMVVYNTATAGTAPNNVTPGYYYNNGAKWIRLADASSPDNIYTTDGTLAANRTVAQAANTLAFNSTATTGTSHFTVDGTTFNVDAVNNRIGIRTAAPNATLDVVGTVGASTLDGIIAPRFTGDELGAKTYTADQTGALVYATAANTASLNTQVEDVNATGYYYFNGNKWIKLSTNAAGIDTSIYSADGTLLGNRRVAQEGNTLDFTSSATTGTSHFTVDGATFNVDAVNNRVGIGNSIPAATLDVAGTTGATTLDGIIAPRFNGDELGAKTYTTYQTGAIVYATAGKTSSTNTQVEDVDTAGYYYFNGTKWKKLTPPNPWNVFNTTNASTSVDDNIYHNQGVYIGIGGKSKTGLTSTLTGTYALSIDAVTGLEIGSMEHNRFIKINGANLGVVNTFGNYLDGSKHLFFGIDALKNISFVPYGSMNGANTAIGNYSQVGAVDSRYNVSLGESTLRNSVRSENNTAIGQESLKSININLSNNNTAIGSQSGYNHTGGSGNIFVGYGARTDNKTGSNQLSIGNVIYGLNINAESISAGTPIDYTDDLVGISTPTPNSTLQVAGSFSLPIRSVSNYTTLTQNDYKILVRNTNSSMVPLITLPDPTTCQGRIYVIQNMVINTSIQFNSPVESASGLIPSNTAISTGSTSISLGNGYYMTNSLELQSDGTNWILTIH